MDRSFLANKDVIAASRKFVCIRLATYEDPTENELLKGIFAPGGTLQNTVFALLAPDGKTQLVRSGRSPVWAFGGRRGPGINQQPQSSIEKMARAMESIALKYPGKGKQSQAAAQVPYLADLALALNVAAADRQPLVVVYSKDKNQREMIERKLSALVWSKRFIGRAQYAPTKDQSAFRSIRGLDVSSGVIVIQPGTFGLTGTVISAISADLPTDRLGDALAKALARHKPSTLSYTQHRREGERQGALWQSKTPVTDGMGRPGGRRR